VSLVFHHQEYPTQREGTEWREGGRRNGRAQPPEGFLVPMNVSIPQNRAYTDCRISTPLYRIKSAEFRPCSLVLRALKSTSQCELRLPSSSSLPSPRAHPDLLFTPTLSLFVHSTTQPSNSLPSLPNSNPSSRLESPTPLPNSPSSLPTSDQITKPSFPCFFKPNR